MFDTDLHKAALTSSSLTLHSMMIINKFWEYMLICQNAGVLYMVREKLVTLKLTRHLKSE